MPERKASIALPMLVIVAALAASVTGLTTDLFQRAYIALSTVAGFGAHDAGPGFLVCEGRLYSVGYWCTPTNLWVSAALLLSGARPRPTRYLSALAAFAVTVSALMIANVLVSFAVHPHVPSWNWGHIPGTFVLYLGSFVWCVRWTWREHARQRSSSAESAGEPSCVNASSPSAPSPS